MRITVALVLVAAAVTHAAEVKSSRNEHKNVESSRTDRRALVEGNSAVEKRAPVIATASPSVSSGIEYADSESKALQREREKSPAQQIYATPVPQLAKISDVLSGHHLEQGPGQFQAAIASHLYSPVSVYQARLSSPTTFEVSAPVASQLAYAEKIAYRPQPVEYTPLVRQYNQLSPQLTYRNVQAAKQQAFARLPEQILIQQPLYQRQILYQNPQLQYQNPQLQYQNQPVYAPAPQLVHQNQIQPYAQQLVAQPPQVQPGIVYARQEASTEQVHEQPAQRELKTQAEPVKVLEKQMLTPEQNYNQQRSEQTQGAVSYASFSQSPPAALFRPQYQQQPQYRYQSQPLIKYQVQQPQQEQHAQPQTQYQTQTQQQPQHQEPRPYQPQPQYQSQIQQAESQAPYQPQYQVQSQHQAESQYQTQVQSQPQYQIQPQYTQKLVPSANAISATTKPAIINAGYFRTLVPVPQAYSGQEVLVQGSGYGGQPIAVAPSFPPVQYFGKFAHSIFGSYQR